MSEIEYGDEGVPQLEMPENQAPETEQYEDNGGNEKQDLDGIKRNYVAYVTASAFAALSALFGILYFTQNKQYDTARSDLAEEKKDARVQRVSDSITISALRMSLDNCDDNTLKDLENKLEQAKRLKILATSDYMKVDKEIEIVKENTEELKRATQNVKKAIKTKKP